MAKKKDYIYNIIGNGCSLYTNFVMTDVTKSVFEIYENFNKEHFDNVPSVPSTLNGFVDMVYNAHNQTYNLSEDVNLTKRNLYVKDNTVVLGFSGGLDSVFQAIYLVHLGYKVVLFHVKGINTYENGQGTKYSKIIADKLSDVGVRYVECEIKKTNDKENPYKQYWPENPIKNQLILSLMLDYCYANNYNKISLGDDFDLSIVDAMVGVNLTDSRELTQEFLKGIGYIIKGIDFIPIQKGYDKLQRIKELTNWGLADDYYSCVLPGRFNATRHESNEKKYDIKLLKNNCGCSCRKCAMHNLLLHYGGVTKFPDQFIEDCWKVMWKNAHSADYKFFAPDIPLESRIKNLFTY
jgi:tRNA(Ile)-lysidine synthase TilS/MesJ